MFELEKIYTKDNDSSVIINRRLPITCSMEKLPVFGKIGNNRQITYDSRRPPEATYPYIGEASVTFELTVVCMENY